MSAFATFDDVKIVSETADELLCRIDGAKVWIPKDAIAIADGVVARPGQQGRLVLPMAEAERLGLARLAIRPPGAPG